MESIGRELGTERRNRWGSRVRLTPGLALRVVLFVALGVFYVAGATEHARVVNTSKARADQTGYLWDAEQVYANWHGQTPEALVGQRMRMPVYAAFLSLFYSPRLNDSEFFEVAKAWNIRLSVGLLALLAVLLAWHLPPLAATNLTLVVAFGYFVFKAGYSQPELLFYFLFFAVFLACWHLFRMRGPASVAMGLLAGCLAGVAYLTKATVPPFLALFLLVYGTRACAQLVGTWRRARQDERRRALAAWGWQAGAAVLVAVSFLGVIYPYASNSKRFFGEYFFNYNTTYYMWFDNGAVARGVMLPHTDANGRLDMPTQTLPTARNYLRTHSVAQVAQRIGGGLQELLVHSYDMYWYLKYAVVYAVFALLLIVSNWRAWLRLVRGHAWLFAFLMLYAATYLPSTAFFGITSGTGSTRFLLAHVAPLLFVLSRFFVQPPFSETTWKLAGARVAAPHFHLLVSVTLALDLAFTVWPRLMTSYAGF